MLANAIDGPTEFVSSSEAEKLVHTALGNVYEATDRFSGELPF
jgi:hypothetical protein